MTNTTTAVEDWGRQMKPKNSGLYRYKTGPTRVHCSARGLYFFTETGFDLVDSTAAEDWSLIEAEVSNEDCERWRSKIEGSFHLPSLTEEDAVCFGGSTWDGTTSADNYTDKTPCPLCGSPGYAPLIGHLVCSNKDCAWADPKLKDHEDRPTIPPARTWWPR